MPSYRAVYAYEPRADIELLLHEGEVVKELERVSKKQSLSMVTLSLSLYPVFYSCDEQGCVGCLRQSNHVCSVCVALRIHEKKGLGCIVLRCIQTSAPTNRALTTLNNIQFQLFFPRFAHECDAVCQI